MNYLIVYFSILQAKCNKKWLIKISLFKLKAWSKVKKALVWRLKLLFIQLTEAEATGVQAEANVLPVVVGIEGWESDVDSVAGVVVLADQGQRC